MVKKYYSSLSDVEIPSLKDLESAQDQTAWIHSYLTSLLAAEEEDAELVDRIMEKFASAGIEDGSLVIQMRDMYEEKNIPVTFRPPLTVDPPSHIASCAAELAQIHNGIEWWPAGGGISGFTGIVEIYGGNMVLRGNFDPEAIYDAEDENEEFLDGLEEQGCDIDDIQQPLDDGQNWIVYHPTEKNKYGEPLLMHVAHGDCIVTPLKNGENISLRSAILNMMSDYFLDTQMLYPM